jgi:hypothetical protein
MVHLSLEGMNKTTKSFKDYIRNYSDVLDKEKNIILSKGGIPKEYWYRQHIPSEIYLTYLKFMRKFFYEKLM